MTCGCFARYFLERHRATRSLRLSASAADALAAHDWPGNVRELERLMERAVTLAESDAIELDDLPVTVRGDYAAAILLWESTVPGACHAR